MDTGATSAVVELAIGLARIEEKVDGVIDRLDTQNGSIAKLTAKTTEHEEKFLVLETKTDLMSKLVKPLLIIAGFILSAILGNHFDPKLFMEFFK